MQRKKTSDKSTEELIAEIRGGLDRGAKPAHMCFWTDDYLRSLERKELLRCWIETAPMRLNPNDSTDFLEEGISPAERHARIVQFVIAQPQGNLMRLCVELMEKLFMAAETEASGRETSAAYWELAQSVAQMAKLSQDKHAEEPRERGRTGGEKTAAHWKRVSEEALRIARSRGLDDGNHSADFVAGKIESEVRDYARLTGRDFPGDSAARKIASYLRSGGVKRVRTVRTP